MTLAAQHQKQLDEFQRRLREAAGEDLEALVLYGSAAGGDFRTGQSDLNLLCLLRRTDAACLSRLAPVVRWWRAQGQPDPWLFTLDELQRSADVFAIELLDIQRRHRVLFGPDHFSSLAVPMTLHRLQVERELRVSLIKLRQAYLGAAAGRKDVLRLMTDSLSTFATLFRHALMACGETPAPHKRGVVEQAAATFGFEAAAVLAVLELREGHRKPPDAAETQALFASYLSAIDRVTAEVDRRLA
jgi:hypothetical protein